MADSPIYREQELAPTWFDLLLVRLFAPLANRLSSLDYSRNSEAIGAKCGPKDTVSW